MDVYVCEYICAYMCVHVWYLFIFMCVYTQDSTSNTTHTPEYLENSGLKWLRMSAPPVGAVRVDLSFLGA